MSANTRFKHRMWNQQAGSGQDLQANSTKHQCTSKSHSKVNGMTRLKTQLFCTSSLVKINVVFQISHWSTQLCEQINLGKNVNLPESELVHDVWSFHKTLSNDNKRSERIGGKGAWAAVVPVWMETVGVSGGWGGPPTSDLLPPGPFRAAQ